MTKWLVPVVWHSLFFYFIFRLSVKRFYLKCLWLPFSILITYFYLKIRCYFGQRHTMPCHTLYLLSLLPIFDARQLCADSLTFFLFLFASVRLSIKWSRINSFFSGIVSEHYMDKWEYRKSWDNGAKILSMKIDSILYRSWCVVDAVCIWRTMQTAYKWRERYTMVKKASFNIT